ncbi:SRF-like protein [Pleurotus eryngii]|uniref:SRF-like protein n=1 Tax=Pleurotus eryngii TaxID=5323 RepID=A0A9P6DFA0_PLEER|nr:SRF-like protein [Pleurotus eryngii]
MGRRKIEIQPITHERNRSVTFLKRKNGLFKKAYELGVLCSVDVAVIIFEERPGHHLKLYQYCSTDIHDIVQRHVRYEGEKDTRGPNDFSGNAGARADDNGDGEDDDVDDDDTQDMGRRGAKRRGDGKVKPEWAKPLSTSLGDLGMGADVSPPFHPLVSAC